MTAGSNTTASGKKVLEGAPFVTCADGDRSRRLQSMGITADELIEEGSSASVEGWDFSWLRDRATEERPSWGYATLVAERMDGTAAPLDLQTGGGEVFAWILERTNHRPAHLAATESWEPNLRIARTNLGPHGVTVYQTPDDGPLLFPLASYDFVDGVGTP